MSGSQARLLYLIVDDMQMARLPRNNSMAVLNASTGMPLLRTAMLPT